MYLLFTALFCFFPLCLSSELATQEPETVGFVREDNTRDTISLILSCFATLGLCVYSAVHLNLPTRHERFYWTVWREVKWCIIGLFGPELVLYTAWRQFASAQQLCDEVREAFDEEKQAEKSAASPDGTNKITSSVAESYGSNQNPPAESFSLAHGFYATMGGFAIDIDTIDMVDPQMFGNAQRLTLTAKGAALLAKCGHLPTVSLDEIKDKNKSDSLAKFLVCVQAGWMIVQVISRRAFNLPSTLLEIHTVAHVVCALLVFLVWWHKPRQVESPTLLRGEWVRPLAAYMYSASRMSGRPPRGRLARFLHPKPELKSLAYLEVRKQEVNADQIGLTQRPSRVQSSIVGRWEPLPSATRKDGEVEPEPEPYMKEMIAERRRLAAEAVSLYPALRDRFRTPEPKGAIQDHGYLIPYTAELVQPYATNWPNAGLLRRTQALVMGSVLWGTSIAYGAIHLTAWDYFFPTYLERLFWHLSAVWVTFSATFWLMTNLLAYFFPGIDRIWISFNSRRLNWLWTGIIAVLCTMCGAAYVASRVFLVVESFISLRRVPAAVYDTPAWSQVFPHL